MNRKKSIDSPLVSNNFNRNLIADIANNHKVILDTIFSYSGACNRINAASCIQWLVVVVYLSFLREFLRGRYVGRSLLCLCVLYLDLAWYSSIQIYSLVKAKICTLPACVLSGWTLPLLSQCLSLRSIWHRNSTFHLSILCRVLPHNINEWSYVILIRHVLIIRKCVLMFILVPSIISFQKDCVIANTPSTEDAIQHFVNENGTMDNIIIQVVNITQRINLIDPSVIM